MVILILNIRKQFLLTSIVLGKKEFSKWFHRRTDLLVSGNESPIGVNKSNYSKL